MFNPPVSPWMGGIWEFLIKYVKRSLKAIIKDRIFTEDCLYTFLCEVEFILNGRPLTSISDDIKDLEPFTPKHLLIGSSSSNFSPREFNSDEINLRKNGVQFKLRQTCFGKVGYVSIYFYCRYVRNGFKN